MPGLCCPTSHPWRYQTRGAHGRQSRTRRRTARGDRRCVSLVRWANPDVRFTEVPIDHLQSFGVLGMRKSVHLLLIAAAMAPLGAVPGGAQVGTGTIQGIVRTTEA